MLPLCTNSLAFDTRYRSRPLTASQHLPSVCLFCLLSEGAGAPPLVMRLDQPLAIVQQLKQAEGLQAFEQLIASRRPRREG